MELLVRTTTNASEKEMGTTATPMPTVPTRRGRSLAPVRRDTREMGLFPVRTMTNAPLERITAMPTLPVPTSPDPTLVPVTQDTQVMGLLVRMSTNAPEVGITAI